MAQTEYINHIDINASREKTWDVLTDFRSYQKWNSVLTLAENDNLEVGQKFSVTIHDGSKKSRFKALTLSVQPHQTFSARQKIIARWFFSATHHFILDTFPNADQEVRFIQKWELTGLISKIFKKQIFKQLDLFNQMNQELKIYVEDGATAKTAKAH